MNRTCLRCKKLVPPHGALQLGDGEYICAKCLAWGRARVAEIKAWREEIRKAKAEGLPKERTP